MPNGVPRSALYTCLCHATRAQFTLCTNSALSNPRTACDCAGPASGAGPQANSPPRGAAQGPDSPATHHSPSQPAPTRSYQAAGTAAAGHALPNGQQLANGQAPQLQAPPSIDAPTRDPSSTTAPSDDSAEGDIAAGGRDQHASGRASSRTGGSKRLAQAPADLGDQHAVAATSGRQQQQQTGAATPHEPRVSLRRIVTDAYAYHGMTELGWFSLFATVITFVLYYHWSSTAAGFKNTVQFAFASYGNPDWQNQALSGVNAMSDGVEYVTGWMQFWINRAQAVGEWDAGRAGARHAARVRSQRGACMVLLWRMQLWCMSAVEAVHAAVVHAWCCGGACSSVACMRLWWCMQQ